MKIFARILLLAIAAFAIAINLFSYYQIEQAMHTLPYRCPLKWVTGLKCAFCGMTHSWIAFMRGDWQLAFQENLFGPPLLVSALMVLVFLSVGKKVNVNQKVGLGTLVVLMVFTILRNLF